MPTPAEFFGYLFMVRDMVHLTHLAQADKSLATHLALAEVYDGMLPLIDHIVELCTAIHGVPEITIPSSKASEDIVADLEAARDYIMENKEIFHHEVLEDIATDIAAILIKGLYKLNYLH